ATATHLPYGCLLPAGLTERDVIGIGDSGRVPAARVEGLDHWSSGPGAASAQDGPFLTSPGLLGPCARASMEQTWGQNGHEKMAWGGKIPGRNGCAARDLNPEPAD